MLNYLCEVQIYGSNSNVVLQSLYVLSLFPALPFLLEVLDS